MSDKDEAIRELAHVARSLVDAIAENQPQVPAVFLEALRNKIDHYAGFGE